MDLESIVDAGGTSVEIVLEKVGEARDTLIEARDQLAEEVREFAEIAFSKTSDTVEEAKGSMPSVKVLVGAAVAVGVTAAAATGFYVWRRRGPTDDEYVADEAEWGAATPAASEPASAREHTEHAEDIDHQLEHVGTALGQAFADAVEVPGDPAVEELLESIEATEAPARVSDPHGDDSAEDVDHELEHVGTALGEAFADAVEVPSDSASLSVIDAIEDASDESRP